MARRIRILAAALAAALCALCLTACTHHPCKVCRGRGFTAGHVCVVCNGKGALR